MKVKPTHLLSCRHTIGTTSKSYYMKCIVLKVMPNRRLKIRVFGDRTLPGHEGKSRIRYVDRNKVSCMPR